MMAEFQLIWGKGLKFEANLQALLDTAGATISYNDVLAVDSFHPAYKTYDVLVRESDGNLYKFVVLFQLRQTAFSCVTI